MTDFKISEFPLLFAKPQKFIYPSAWLEHIPFAHFAVECLKPSVIVELGVHNGSSYSAFCEAVKALKLSTKCYGVDTWEGEEHAGFYTNEIYDELKAHHSKDFPSISTLLRCTFDEALTKIQDNSIDLLHIDGLHTYEAVKHDFDSWLPKVKEGGVVLFHDTQEKQRDFGVWKLWAEVSEKYPSYEFKHCHGLGVLVTGSNPKFEAFFEEINSNEFIQNSFVSLGKSISADVESIILEKELRAKIQEQALEVLELHKKADSMRIMNRVKRLFGFFL